MDEELKAQYDKDYAYVRKEVAAGRMSLKQAKVWLHLRVDKLFTDDDERILKFRRKFYKGRAGSDTAGCLEDEEE